MVAGIAVAVIVGVYALGDTMDVKFTDIETRVENRQP
jgi:Flp pilus assembly pilin Flp